MNRKDRTTKVLTERLIAFVEELPAKTSKEDQLKLVTERAKQLSGSSPTDQKIMEKALFEVKKAFNL